MKTKQADSVKLSSAKPFPLRMAEEGKKVKIFSLTGGKKIHDRLAGLGIHTGEQVEIIQNRNNGKLLVGHGNARFFLGGGMALKIYVVGVGDERQIKTMKDK